MGKFGFGFQGVKWSLVWTRRLSSLKSSTARGAAEGKVWALRWLDTIVVAVVAGEQAIDGLANNRRDTIEAPGSEKLREIGSKGPADNVNSRKGK